MILSFFCQRELYRSSSLCFTPAHGEALHIEYAGKIFSEDVKNVLCPNPTKLSIDDHVQSDDGVLIPTPTM